MRVTIAVDVCNVCQDPRKEVEPFRFTYGDDGVNGHICAEDRDAIVEQLNVAEPAPPPPPRAAKKAATKPSARKAAKKAAAKKTPGRGVTTEEDLEKLRGK